jgi:hypothetical protein
MASEEDRLAEELLELEALMGVDRERELDREIAEWLITAGVQPALPFESLSRNNTQARADILAEAKRACCLAEETRTPEAIAEAKKRVAAALCVRRRLESDHRAAKELGDDDRAARITTLLDPCCAAIDLLLASLKRAHARR